MRFKDDINDILDRSKYPRKGLKGMPRYSNWSFPGIIPVVMMTKNDHRMFVTLHGEETSFSEVED